MQLRADQICVYVTDHTHDYTHDHAHNADETVPNTVPNTGPDTAAIRRRAFVIEYKAPHKLTLPCLRAGLHDMDIYRDVVNRATVPPSEDEEAAFQYGSERLVASAICQTYHYMLEGGLTYSYLTTGEAIVFLKIDWADPSTLQYHLAQPREEVEVQREERPEEALHCTAVSQVLAFALQAVQSQPQKQGARNAAIEKAYTWEVDWTTVLAEVGDSVRKKSLEMSRSDYRPRTYRAVDRSPIVLRSRREGSRGCEPAENEGDATQASRSSDDSGSDPPDTPLKHRTRASRARRLQEPASGRSRDQPLTDDRGGSSRRQAGLDRVGDCRMQKIDGRKLEAEMEAKEEVDMQSNKDVSSPPASPPPQLQTGRRQFCTQACLLGLVRGEPLDPGCPNMQRHIRSGGRGIIDAADGGRAGVRGRRKQGCHQISHKVWLRLLAQQLTRTLDDGIMPYAGKSGARGVMFVIELLSHGYVFVAKGTTQVFVPDLQHEAAVYRRLSPLQGFTIPVMLGAVDLDPSKPYHYDTGVRVVHLLLQSWGGVEVCSNAAVAEVDRGEQARLLQEAVSMMHAQGVAHRDVRRKNALWNAERERVMQIDFERSELMEDVRAKTVSRPLLEDKRSCRVVLGELSLNEKRSPVVGGQAEEGPYHNQTWPCSRS